MKSEIRASRFVTLDKQIIEPGIMNQCGEISAILSFYSDTTNPPNTCIAKILIELPQQDVPIRGITITYNY